jgi:hypothetical protein
MLFVVSAETKEKDMNKRTFIRTSAMGAIGTLILPLTSFNQNNTLSSTDEEGVVPLSSENRTTLEALKEDFARYVEHIRFEPFEAKKLQKDMNKNLCKLYEKNGKMKTAYTIVNENMKDGCVYGQVYVKFHDHGNFIILDWNILPTVVENV